LLTESRIEEVMKRNGVIELMGYWAVATGAIVFALAATPAAFASSGTLVLTNSTTLTEDHHGNILINGSNVVLDCGGHTVFGPGESGFSGGIEVAGNLSGVTVKRCSVTGFAVNGIFGGGGASDGRYEANNLYANGNHGMQLDVGSGYVVLGNKSRSNGGIGIVLTGASRSWIVHNTGEENRNWAGIALLDGSHDNVLLNNTALRNSIGYVLDGATGNELRNNTASLNDTQGFVLIRGASDNVLGSNTANQNLTGFEITEGSNSNQIDGNMANRNTSDGFKIYQSNGNGLRENTGDRNGDIGFLIFGGSSSTTVTHNIGLHNGSLDALDDDLGTGNAWKENRFGQTSGIAQ
jgi:parallel beta-helix repeat protein